MKQHNNYDCICCLLMLIKCQKGVCTLYAHLVMLTDSYYKYTGHAGPCMVLEILYSVIIAHVPNF